MRLLVLAVLLLSGPAWSTEIYRWVDSTGQAHYSDQWRPGAEKIQLQESPVFSAPRPAAPARATAPADESPQTSSRYESLIIVSPAQEEVLWNIEGQLRVRLQVSPGLQAGHDLRLLLDGREQEISPGSSEVLLTDVFRGVHTLQAQVVNEAGQVLISSEPTTFAVRQTSLANPSRPAIP